MYAIGQHVLAPHGEYFVDVRVTALRGRTQTGYASYTKIVAVRAVEPGKRGWRWRKPRLEFEAYVEELEMPGPGP